MQFSAGAKPRAAGAASKEHKKTMESAFSTRFGLKNLPSAKV